MVKKDINCDYKEWTPPFYKRDVVVHNVGAIVLLSISLRPQIKSTGQGRLPKEIDSQCYQSLKFQKFGKMLH